MIDIGFNSSAGAMGYRIEWLNIMSVGVAEFDNDHKNLIALLGKIKDALERQNLDLAKLLAADLTALAADHCRREEEFLKRIKFPNFDNVTNAQKDSLARIDELLRRISADPQEAKVFIENMQTALVEYLLKADINFKTYVMAHGHSDLKSP